MSVSSIPSAQYGDEDRLREGENIAQWFVLTSDTCPVDESFSLRQWGTARQLDGDTDRGTRSHDTDTKVVRARWPSSDSYGSILSLNPSPLQVGSPFFQ